MKIVLVSFALAVTSAGSYAALIQTETLKGEAHGVVLGKVTTVLDGQCTGAEFRKIPEHAFLYALGGGSLKPDAALQGEGLVLDGRMYIKSLDAKCGYCTTSAPDGVSPSGWGAFVAGVNADARPIARYKLEGTSQSMDHIYTELVARHGKLIGVAGVGHFTTLETSAIRKAPVYGEPILGAKRAEYFHPKAVLSDVDAVFFGMVLRSAADETSATKAVFYVNPDDKATTGIQSHTHFATVSASDGIDPAEPKTALGKVQAVAHLLTQSRMTSGELVVYQLNELDDIPVSGD